MSKVSTWTKRSAKNYWKKRNTEGVLSHDLTPETSLLVSQREHEAAFTNQVELYLANLEGLDVEETTEVASAESLKVREDLAFWIEFLSWTYCNDCHLLSRQMLPHNYSQRNVTKPPACICKSNKYVIPDSDEIPLALCNLKMKEIYVLRPFDVHCGDISRAKNGYRLKNGPFRLSASKHSVLQKIESLQDEQMKRNCTVAYRTLMRNQLSSYSKFVHMRKDIVESNQTFGIVDIYVNEGIECAIWPSLYPFTSWCESSLSGNANRDSSKISFMAKVFSNIVDYAMLFELLLYHYDRWMFKTVTGAVNSARILRCSPMRALDTKSFSPGYWQWQHLFLLDAVKQFGLPSFFVTISPFEWTFPFPDWLNRIRRVTSVGKTFLPAYETIHIANVLEQIVRGYLCGSNSARWTRHLFQDDLPSDENNVQTYFYRFEFQKRGTLHMHMLVWLRDISKCQYSRFRADIPQFDHKLAALANRLQKSSKKSPFLKVQSQPTTVVEINGRKVLSVIHPANAFVQNLRAYIDTLLPTLNCSMDVQATDGRSMLLKYVSSYVSKWHDAVSVDSLYSPNVNGHQTALRYLKSLTPCEPEMWMTLSSVKIAWSCSRTKRYVVPLPEKANENKEAAKYRRRPPCLENLSFAEWLRAVNSTPMQPKEYKGGNTLVGLRYVSVYRKEFFFQQTLMNHPHRDLRDLYHPDFHRMPKNLGYFASAIAVTRQWDDISLIREQFELEGHKQYYIDTVVAYVTSLHDLLQCWRRQICSAGLPINDWAQPTVTDFNLQGKQLAIMQLLQAALVFRSRDLAYAAPDVPATDMEVDDEDDDVPAEEEDFPQLHSINVNSMRNDWKRFLLVTGNPGCGKTHTMNACIAKCITFRLKVCVVAPTGFLACKYKSTFGEKITTDTVHAAFKYPVDNSMSPSINWELSRFDFIVIDEISMIPKPIFKHILTTIDQLPVRPIVFFSGDEAQQQPIMTVDKKIVQVENIMSDANFLNAVTHIKLTQQFRCHDNRLQQFLMLVRNWKPTQNLLDTIQSDIVCYDEPSDDIIINALKRHNQATVLTVTKRACDRVNLLVVNNMFPGKEPIMLAKTDSDLPPIPLYKGMRIMFTQNRDKERHFVNGQRATVEFATRKTILASLPNGQILNIYMVTYNAPNGDIKTVYPFVPAYATTICKAQGQTLDKVLLWFDIDRIPAGTAYVAVSRVRTLNDISFMTPMKVCHFTPVIH